MDDKWDGLARPPQDASTNELMQWVADHMAAFRREHPDLPQGEWHSLSGKQQKAIIKAFNRAREAAQVEEAAKTNPKLAKALERAHRTGAVTVTQSHKKGRGGR